MAASVVRRPAATLARGYAEIHARVAATKLWRSVADQAGLVLEVATVRGPGAERDAAAGLLAALRAYAALGATP